LLNPLVKGYKNSQYLAVSPFTGANVQLYSTVQVLGKILNCHNQEQEVKVI